MYFLLTSVGHLVCYCLVSSPPGLNYVISFQLLLNESVSFVLQVSRLNLQMFILFSVMLIIGIATKVFAVNI